MSESGGGPSSARLGASPHRPRTRSGLAVFAVFFAVFAFCAGVVVWLVTQPFRDLAESAGQQARQGAVSPQSWQQADSASRVLSCQTPVAPDATEASLADRHGAGNVVSADVRVGEGFTERGTVLFPASPDDRVDIVWKDSEAKKAPRVVYIRGDRTRWRTPKGLTLGSDLRGLEQANGGPFTLSGFAWGYSGTVMSWRGGALDATPGAPCTIRARLRPAPGAQTRGVEGEQAFGSDLPAMQALNPRVYEVWVEYW